VNAEELKAQQKARDEAEVKEQELKDKQQHVFTFSYSLGNDPSGGNRAHVLAHNEGEAKALLIKHIEARHGKGPDPETTKTNYDGNYDAKYENRPYDASHPYDPNATPGPRSAAPFDPNATHRDLNPNPPHDSNLPYSNNPRRPVRDPGHIYDRAHYRVSTGVIAVNDVITTETALPTKGFENRQYDGNRRDPGPYDHNTPDGNRFDLSPKHDGPKPSPSPATPPSPTRPTPPPAPGPRPVQ
jgi:hypothetical protein